MNKKKAVIGISLLAVVLVCFVLYKLVFPEEFKVREDEIAIRIKLDLKEDIGLVVYDYTIDDHRFGGGTSNADRSTIKRNEELIITWNKDELKKILDEKTDSDKYRFRMTFRIITEYIDPNYENIYPEEITRYLEPIEWTAKYGEEYHIHITGDKTNGYEIALEQ